MKRRGSVCVAEVIRSAVLEGVAGGAGVPHGFSTRRGGVSSGAFESLNFGNPGELPAGITRDSKETIARNFGLVLEEIGAAGRRVEQVHQVHGAWVHVVRGPVDAQAGRLRHQGQGEDQGRGVGAAGGIVWGDVKADAIVTDDPWCVVAVRVADCAPVLMASADGRVVAAVHAGWRGVVAGVVPAAVKVMREIGARGEIVAAVGPCISFAAFEVGPEVVAEFELALPGCCAAGLVRAGAGDRSFVDVRGAIVRQLAACGVSRVDVVARCTMGEPEVFFSHRRGSAYGAGVTGRMVGVIGVAEGIKG